MKPAFAMEDATVLAVVAAVGAAGTAIGAGAKWLLELRDKNKRETQIRDDKTRVDSLEEYKVLLDDTRKQLDRYQSVAESQQQVIIRMIKLHANCRAENREQYGFIVVLYGILKMCVSSMTKAGLPIPDMPELPPKPERTDDDDDIEFLRRTTEHNSRIIKEARSNEGPAGGR